MPTIIYMIVDKIIWKAYEYEYEYYYFFKNVHS